MEAFKKYIDKYQREFRIAILFLTLEACRDLIRPTIMSKIIDVGVDVGVKNIQVDYVLKMNL